MSDLDRLIKKIYLLRHPPSGGLPDAPGQQVGQIAVYKTPPLALPQSGNKTIFSIQNGGSIFPYNPLWILDIFGIITTTIGAVANATKLQALMDALTAVDLCATLDVNGLVAGGTLSITGTLANAMTTNANGVQIAQATPIHLSGGQATGIIRVNTAGSDGGTGRVSWVMLARPAYGVRVIPTQS